MTLIENIKLQYKTGSLSIKLVFWNCFLFLIPEILFSVLKLFSVSVNYINYTSLSSNYVDLAWKPWSLLSYSFFHSGILHLGFNMIMLYYVSQLFATFFTQKQLLGVYILGAIFSGIGYIIGYTFLPTLVMVSTSMIGASAAIMALLFATVTYEPYMEINFFVWKIKLWHFAALFIVLDLIQISANNTGGHLAHLSGALFGFLYIKILQRGTDLTSGITAIIDFFVTLFNPKAKTPFKKVHVNPKKPTQKKESKVIVKDKTQQQIDEILDKISQSGYDSLTKAEKDFLFNPNQKE